MIPLTLLAQEPVATTMWNGPTAQALGLWIAVGVTLAIYTFLYRDNPVFKLAEHIFVGVSNGYLLWQFWFGTVRPNLAKPLWHAIKYRFVSNPPPLEPNESLWLLVPAVFCILLLLRFIPRIAWLSRWSFAFFVGATAGTLIPLTIQAQIFTQIKPHLDGVVVRTDGHFVWWGTVSLLLTLGGVIAALTYFLFSVEHKGPIRHISRIGVVFVMIAFGASFGYTVMARQSLLIGRVNFLIENARAEAPAAAVAEAPPDNPPPSPHHATLWVLFSLIALVTALEILRKSRAAEPTPPETKPAT